MSSRARRLASSILLCCLYAPFAACDGSNDVAGTSDSGAPRVDPDAALHDAAGEGGSAASSCHAHDFEWTSAGVGTNAAVEIDGVARDANGAAWGVGLVMGDAMWGNESFSSPHAGAELVVKFDPHGKLLFARAFVAVGGASSAKRVRLDAEGNAYVAGEFVGDLALGSAHLRSDTHKISLMKLDPNGTVLWARQSEGTGVHEAFGLALDSAGNAYVAGAHERDATFGGVTVPGGDTLRPFAAKYTAQGDVRWARSWASSFPGEFRGISGSADGTTFIVGQLSTSIDFDGVVVGSPSPVDGAGFLLKLDPDGNVVWGANVRAEGAQGERTSLTSVATDDTGNAFVAGGATGRVHLAPASLRATTPKDAGDEGGDAAAGADVDADAPGTLVVDGKNGSMVLARYDGNGSPSWARLASGTDGTGFATDVTAGQGRVVVVGTRSGGALQFDSLPLERSGVFFVAQYDDRGTVQWVTGSDGPSRLSEGSATSVALGAGGPLIGGWVHDGARFGDTTISTSTPFSTAGVVVSLCE